MTAGKQDGRALRGDATRRAILNRAADIASVDGLDGLSIGRLATELGISKSGVFAHFGAKQELQLATVEHAADIFRWHVVEPAMEQAPGIGRVVALTRLWLEYSRERAFPGGCFFVAVGAEYDARQGRVHDLIAHNRRSWLRFLQRTVTDARQLGQLRDDTDPAQLAFELDAVAQAANSDALLLEEDSAYDRAHAAIVSRLRLAATDPALVP